METIMIEALRNIIENMFAWILSSFFEYNKLPSHMVSQDSKPEVIYRCRSLAYSSLFMLERACDLLLRVQVALKKATPADRLPSPIS